MILFSWLAYRKQRPEFHRASHYRLPGGTIMAWSCLLFFMLMLCALALKPDTRTGLMIAPLWFIWLVIVWRSKRAGIGRLALKKQTDE